MNLFRSFKLGYIHSPDNVSFLICIKEREFFQKTNKIDETKTCFPNNGWMKEKTKTKELLPNDAFFSILRKSKPLDELTYNFWNLVRSDLSTEQVVARSIIYIVPSTVVESYVFLQTICECYFFQIFSNSMTTKILLVAALEALQKFTTTRGLTSWSLDARYQNCQFLFR